MFILGGLEEILMVLEDNQVTLQTMMGSRFIMGVKDEVTSNSTNPDRTPSQALVGARSRSQHTSRARYNATSAMGPAAFSSPSSIPST